MSIFEVVLGSLSITSFCLYNGKYYLFYATPKFRTLQRMNYLNKKFKKKDFSNDPNLLDDFVPEAGILDADAVIIHSYLDNESYLELYRDFLRLEDYKEKFVRKEGRFYVYCLTGSVILIVLIRLTALI